MEYLVEWACGKFTVMSGEQLKKDLNEWTDGWKQNPRPVYRLIPGQAPKRYKVVFGRNHDYWYLEDQYGNHMMIL